MVLSRITRNNRRIELNNKYEEKRKMLKNLIKSRRLDPNIDINTHMKRVFELNKLPRNSSKSRIRNRCFITGRPRAYSRYFGICLMQLRKLFLHARIPGIRIASW